MTYFSVTDFEENRFLILKGIVFWFEKIVFWFRRKSCFHHLLILIRHDICNKSCLRYMETQFLPDFFLRTQLFHDDSTIYICSTKIVYSKFVKHEFCTIYVTCRKGIMGRIMRAKRLSSKLFKQGYLSERLKSSFRKFYGRYGDLI